MPSFRGSFEHTLDDRGRVAIPAKYRTEFPNNLAVIAPAPEGCLRVFPEAAFQQMSEELASIPATTREGRRLRRLFDAQAFDAELDRQGRILIPARLRETAELDGTVVVAGNRECLEIWNPQRLERELEEAEADSPEVQRSEE
jgi:MraZ protein